LQEPLPVPDAVALEQARILKRTVGELDAIVLRLVQERQASAERPADVMSMLLDAKDEDGQGLDTRALRDEVMTLILAGHETTANALAWAWQLVAAHPEVEERFYDEVDAVLGDRPARPEDVSRLALTDAIFKETLRLYPPVYFTARQAVRPTKISAFDIPEGISVFINLAALHRRPEIFADPERFRPDRFLGPDLPRGAFLPFGAGPRTCPGNHFSMLEGVLAMATIAQRRALRRSAGLAEVEPLITLRPKAPVWMSAPVREARATSGRG
jgi:cytochrome P450